MGNLVLGWRTAPECRGQWRGELLDQASVVVERRRRASEASSFDAPRLPPRNARVRYRFLPVRGSVPSKTRSWQ